MEDKRRVLTFINEMNCGGAQRVLSHLMNSWVEKDYEVILVTVSRDPSFYHLHKNIQWISLGNVSVARNTLSAILITARRIFRLRKILKRYQPISALAFMPSANVQLALASLGLSHKTVGSERVYPPLAGLSPLWELARSLTYRFLDTVIVQTQDAADWMRPNIKTKSIQVIPNPVITPGGVDTNAIEVSVNQVRKHTIFAVGRLVPQKGFDILISAFAKLEVKYPKWKLYIAGEGDSRKGLEKAISDFQLNDRIILLGEIQNIEWWYQNSSLFVMSSRFEGFPNALAEAMAFGLPVVSFDCKTGPRELIEHGVNGLLVEPENESALVHTLSQLMSNKSLRKKISIRATEVKNRFSLERVESAFLNILDLRTTKA